MRKTIRNRFKITIFSLLLITSMIFIGQKKDIQAEEYNLVDKLEESYEYHVLHKRCDLDQIKRDKENKTIIEGYCDNLDNLEKYRLNNSLEEEQDIIHSNLDINKLAYSVAMAETGNCKLGYGKMYNNCFGIKNGNTAPCKEIGINKMCIYDNPGESYEAFKKIWTTWYKTIPNIEKASRWTGHDNRNTWLNNVLHYYNS